MVVGAASWCAGMIVMLVFSSPFAPGVPSSAPTWSTDSWLSWGSSYAADIELNVTDSPNETFHNTSTTRRGYQPGWFYVFRANAWAYITEGDATEGLAGWAVDRLGQQILGSH